MAVPQTRSGHLLLRKTHSTSKRESDILIPGPSPPYLTSNSGYSHFEFTRGKMKSTTKLILIATFAFLSAFMATSSAQAQRGYGGGGQRITCSSDNGKRNWCDAGGSRDIRMARQISGSACIQNQTWGVDRRGLWVDRGCRAEFFVASAQQGPPGPGRGRIVNCSSDNGKRNWCDAGGSRNIRIARQISGSACIENQTWGVDRRGLWVDRGCRADFSVR
jgi:hypothetical protein